MEHNRTSTKSVPSSMATISEPRLKEDLGRGGTGMHRVKGLPAPSAESWMGFP